MTDYLTIPMPIVTTLILVAILITIGTLLTSRKLLTKIVGNLKWFASAVLIAGFVVYFIGYWLYYDEELNIVALTFRSLLSSIGMFALQSDLQYFVQNCVKESPLFLGVFAFILIPYEDLPEEEKVYDRNTSIETLKLILKLGFEIEKK